MIGSSLSIETITKSKTIHTTTKSVRCQDLASRSSHIKLAIYFSYAYVSYTWILSTMYYAQWGSGGSLTSRESGHTTCGSSRHAQVSFPAISCLLTPDLWPLWGNSLMNIGAHCLRWWCMFICVYVCAHAHTQDGALNWRFLLQSTLPHVLSQSIHHGSVIVSSSSVPI